MAEWDAVVVGSGPNGLSAAVAAARTGAKVLVLEAQPTPGGAARTLPLTLPGFLHDFGSAVHPFAALSPFFRSLPLEDFGLRWVRPEIPLAHPLPNGEAAVLLPSLEATADHMGVDGARYRQDMPAMVEGLRCLVEEVACEKLPRHPSGLARLGAASLMPATSIAGRFRTTATQALIAGLAAHSALPLDNFGTAGIALSLAAAAHLVGWPFPAGGAQQITAALTACLASHGGRLETHCEVRSLAELPPAKFVFWDVTPRQLLAIAGDELAPAYRRSLARYRYGAGACKLDWALAAPVPWTSELCRHAGTLHLGGSLEEIAVAEAEVARGRIPQRPFVLFSQPSLFDPTRAPDGLHTAWAYCHVPNGSAASMADAVEEQIERYAPGFRRLILARHETRASEFAAHDANLVGGDVGGGSLDIRQMILRPGWRAWSVPLLRVGGARHFLCSASTPPGPGVHGMCGYLAARVAFGKKVRG